MSNNPRIHTNGALAADYICRRLCPLRHRNGKVITIDKAMGNNTSAVHMHMEESKAKGRKLHAENHARAGRREPEE